MAHASKCEERIRELEQNISELERDALNFPTLAEFSNLQEDYEKAQQEIDSFNSIREADKKILIQEIEKKLEEGINAALSHTLPYLAEKVLRELLKEQL